jgi:hypothetical protein
VLEQLRRGAHVLVPAAAAAASAAAADDDTRERGSGESFLRVHILGRRAVPKALRARRFNIIQEAAAVWGEAAHSHRDWQVRVLYSMVAAAPPLRKRLDVCELTPRQRAASSPPRSRSCRSGQVEVVASVLWAGIQPSCKGIAC